MKDMILLSCMKTSNIVSDARQSIVKFINKQDGVTAIEYAVIAVAVTAALMSIFGDEGNFTSALKSKFDSLTDALNGTGSQK
ncbi:Flp family type IVb pilin [Erwinia oleae]|uniref:Flp family type IVb pilin n=1 Tax=Erwinia oleae TaxID=796334 RepID=UPI00068E51DC|nr:Flp family type IVb pilin [Erwinia oleae]